MKENNTPVNPRLGQVGGQAVMEGVMMRSPKTTAIAVRRVDDGEIVVRSSDSKTVRTKYKFLNLPIIRGIVNLVEMLILSFSTLTASTEMMGIEGTVYEEEPSKLDKWLDEHFGKKMLAAISAVAVVLGLVLAMTLFVILPAWLTNLVMPDTPTGEWKLVEMNGEDFAKEQKDLFENEKLEVTFSFDGRQMSSKLQYDGIDQPELNQGIDYKVSRKKLTVGNQELDFSIKNNKMTLSDDKDSMVLERIGGNSWRNRLKCLIEGLLKVAIFIAYLYLTSLMKDIRRVYQYHGAEHKSIFCYEAGLDLTVENVKKQSRFHPRCGTSFLFVMVFVSILVSIVFISGVWGWLRVLLKLCLLPICVGLGYEFIRYAGKHDNKLTRILSAPGLWMQRITTREPDDSMMEVAIVSIKSALREEFPDFDVPFEDAYLAKKQENNENADTGIQNEAD